MFSNVSMTGAGLALLLLNLALKLLGNFTGHSIVVPQEQLQAFVDGASQVISLILMVWGQTRRPDLVAGMFRRKPRTSDEE